MVFAILALLPQATVFDITKYGASPNPGDDTAGIQRALDAARDKPGSIVFVPRGNFEASTLTMYSDTILEGEGDESVIKGTKQGQLSLININAKGGGSPNPAENVKNITIRKLALKDRVVEDGNRPHRHLLNFNAVSNVKIHDVLFYGYMGDAIYLGSGGRGTPRHNFDISITRNRFDGVNRKNRNGIAIIDGTRVTITDNSFRRSSEMGPGMLDIEPNKNTFHWVQDIVIERNSFEDGRSGIKADIPFANTKLEKPFINLTIRNNTFKNLSVVGIGLAQQNQDDPKPATNMIITDNTFTNVGTGILVRGFSKVQVTNNSIQDAEVGLVVGTGNLPVYDLSVKTNTFRNIGNSKDFPEASAIMIRNAGRVQIMGNKASDLKVGSAAGPLVFLQSKGKTEDITIEGNEFLSGVIPRGKSQVLVSASNHSKGSRVVVRGNIGG